MIQPRVRLRRLVIQTPKQPIVILHILAYCRIRTKKKEEQKGLELLYTQAAVGFEPTK